MEVQTYQAPTAEELANGPTTTPAPAATDAKPDWLGDFETPEAMAKAYAELRAKMSKEGAPKPDTTPAATAATPATTEATPEAAAQAAQDAGLNLADVEAEFMTSGELKAETYEALEKAGYDRKMVDNYIAGQQAIAEGVKSRVEAHVGGADKLEAMLGWAATGLTAAEATAFNKTIDTADEAGVMLALEGLAAKYAKAEGSEPNLLTGGERPASGDVFRSPAEVTRAMGDPRYATDAAYRDDVAAKLLRSNIF